MLFYTVEEFFRRAESVKPLTREEEKVLAAAMKNGDEAAKTRLIEGYLPFTAGVIRRQPPQRQTLRLVLRCCMLLEREVQKFNFLQEGETFAHRLSWGLRQAVTREIVER